MIKRLITPLIAITAWLLCGCMPFQSIAQTSTEHLYKTLTGDNVRLCTDPSTGNSIISYNGHVNYMPYNFIYHKQGSTSTHYYESSSGTPNTNTPDNYNVKDIEIVGDYCYFCGSYITSEFVYYMGLGMMLETTETGYIGRFPLSDIESGVSPMTIQFCIIAGTKTFSKLEGFDIWESGNRIKYLFLIGTTTNDLSTFAAVKDNGIGVSYGLQITQSTETITDFTTTANFIVTVSRFSNEPYTFGLRGELITNIMNTIPSNANFPMFPYLNKYDTYGVNTATMPRPDPPTLHDDKVDIKIADVWGSDEVVVAYDCSGGAFDVECLSDLYHTALFYVDNSTYDPLQDNMMSIPQAQLVSKNQATEKSLVNIFCPNYTSTILFHNYLPNTGNYSGEIQFPLWTSFGSIDNLTIEQQDLQDMYFNTANQRVNFAGFLRADNRVVHFQQDFYNRKHSCHSTSPKATSEEMTTPNIMNVTYSIQKTYGSQTWGNNLDRTPLQTNYNIKCITN